MNAKKKKVLIVDDHPIVRQGLAQLLRQEHDLTVCGEADHGQGLPHVIAELKPDILVLDLTLKDTSGIDVIKELAPKFPDLPILVLSIHDESLYAERALRAGAKGYIMKEEAADKVVTAIREVLKGDIYVGEKLKSRLLSKALGTPKAGASPLETLSDRELEVFRLLGQGYSTRRIAERFGRSIKTVEIYRANIKQKLGLKDAAELIHCAVRWAQSPN
jgi:DNA-binding NarL/FixJ family response regulator